jgi:hypothetical protein
MKTEIHAKDTRITDWGKAKSRGWRKDVRDELLAVRTREKLLIKWGCSPADIESVESILRRLWRRLKPFVREGYEDAQRAKIRLGVHREILRKHRTGVLVVVYGTAAGLFGEGVHQPESRDRRSALAEGTASLFSIIHKHSGRWIAYERVAMILLKSGIHATRDQVRISLRRHPPK